MKAKKLPSAALLRERFDYDPETGIVTRKVGMQNAPAGSRVGSLGTSGALWVRVNYERHTVHRVIWKWMTGNDPAQDIDHINRDPADNRWANLREATRSQNLANRRPYKSKSGMKGVHWCSFTGRWIASITIDGKAWHLGRFDTPEAAHAVYAREARAAFGAFANLT